MSKEGIDADPAKVSAVRDFPTPTDLRLSAPLLPTIGDSFLYFPLLQDPCMVLQGREWTLCGQSLVRKLLGH